MERQLLFVARGTFKDGSRYIRFPQRLLGSPETHYILQPDGSTIVADCNGTPAACHAPHDPTSLHVRRTLRAYFPGVPIPIPPNPPESR